MGVRFHQVRKVFPDGTIALNDFSLEFDTGEFVVLLGPSGSGKTTACRILAGLEEATGGTVEVDGRDITRLPPRERGMSMVFQNYALYSHKSVFDNIAYPLKVRGMTRKQRERKVREIADMLRIDELLRRRPRELSGGQAQRVAVARALVWDPAICLMDEPLSNLDALLRLHTRTELKRLHQELGRTFVFVTHDQEEAMTLGTRIAVMSDGALVQFDTPRNVYRRPATRFVAEFIGRPAMNTLDGLVQNGRFYAGVIELPADGLSDGPAALGVRPEHLVVHETEGQDRIALQVDVVEVVEPDTLLFLRGEGVSFVARLVREGGDPDPKSIVYVEFPPRYRHWFDASAGTRIRSGT
jgi:ABC-type sugar transport system ATPase subunit